MNLQGKRIMVVGGSRGIGASAARLCASHGATISIVYRSRDAEAESVVADTGGAAYRADASDEGELDRAFGLAGPQDGLVVSAGIFEGCPIREMSVDFWERTMSINLRSTFLSVKAFLKNEADTPPAARSIVIVTSTAGQRGSDIYSAYATSKAAQIIFMRSMAKELGEEGIRVNCVAPAWTETEMADASLTELGRESVAKNFALGRIGQPLDVANAIAFLLSDEACFITGSTITVDGGMDMRG